MANAFIFSGDVHQTGNRPEVDRKWTNSLETLTELAEKMTQEITVIHDAVKGILAANNEVSYQKLYVYEIFRRQLKLWKKNSESWMIL